MSVRSVVAASAALPLRLTVAGAALLAVMIAPQPWLRAVAALVVLGLAWADPEPWTYLAAFCIPFSSVVVQTGRLRFSPADVAVWGAFAGWCGVALRQGVFAPGARRWSSADMGVLLLFAASAFSLLVARDLIAGLDAFRLLVLQPALLYAVIRFGRWPDAGVDRIADAFVAGGAALALAGLWNYSVAGYVEQAGGVNRLLVPFYDSPNHISLYLGRTAATAFCVAAFAQTMNRRWLHAAAFGVMALAFFLTFSRAGLLLGLPAAAALIVVAILRSTGEQRVVRPFWQSPLSASLRDRRLLVALGVLAVIVVALMALTTPRYVSLMRADDVTAGSRLLIWRGAARMIADNPALGVGIGNFFARYPQYMLPEGWREPLLYHAHNAALDFWSMLGIGGLATLIWLEVAFWRTVVRLRRPKLSPDMRALVIGLAAGMAYALAHGLVDTLYFLPDLALAFMLALGMVGTLDLAPGRAADAP